jgi:futalosine hydrolase
VTILIVTAVDAERDAALRSLPHTATVQVGFYEGVVAESGAGEVHAFSCGVGPVAAAITTATLLALGATYDLVVSAGIAGGFSGRAEIGDVVLADQSIAADQGVLTDEGFLTLRDLGLPGHGGYALSNGGHRTRLATGSYRLLTGDVLTLSSMTGTQERATELAARYPNAVAEAMEGYAVVEAVQRLESDSTDVIELRAISNLIGPRDRSTWNIPRAFDALAEAMSLLLKEPLS